MRQQVCPPTAAYYENIFCTLSGQPYFTRFSPCVKCFFHCYPKKGGEKGQTLPRPVLPLVADYNQKLKASDYYLHMRQRDTEYVLHNKKPLSRRGNLQLRITVVMANSHN